VFYRERKLIAKKALKIFVKEKKEIKKRNYKIKVVF
jgi:hypothetical protein